MSARISQRGFTIVEVGFSIAIIALLIGLLLVGINAMNKSARRAVEQQNVASLKMAVDHFQDTFGFLPPLVYDVRTGQTPPQGVSATEPVTQRSVAGIQRLTPVVYNIENSGDWDFLRGENSAQAHNRFSVHSIPYYLLGALDEEVDGVQGPGFRTPLPDGSFRVAGGQRTEPLFDVSKNAEGLWRDASKPHRVELRDRNGIAYRYYRWLPGNEHGEINESDDLNIPELLGAAADDPELRSAKFAIVAAGPNRAFGEEETEGKDELAQILGLPTSDPIEKLEEIGRQDNIVEVGR